MSPTFSGSPKWKDGRHFGKHQAGTDLTEDLKKAPHGPEVLEKITLIGPFHKASDDKSQDKLVSPTRKRFIFMAGKTLPICSDK